VESGLGRAESAGEFFLTLRQESAGSFHRGEAAGGVFDEKDDVDEIRGTAVTAAEPARLAVLE
jgi:hypothetical protein